MDNFDLASLIAKYLRNCTLDVEEVEECMTRDGMPYMEVTTPEGLTLIVSVVESWK